MTRFFALTALCVSLTNQALASDNLVAISSPSLRVDRGPEFADVQPTAFVNFAFASETLIF
ncbi:MAG: hypothetical protein NTV34_10290 [Proteobacteria bacterium]|nr:hypothetical protein [Pseudomonadota bacterium]